MNNNVTMTGTTGTHFEVVSATPAGNLGYRQLGVDKDGQFRVRVDSFPQGVSLGFGYGWNQPGSSPETRRYSKVVTGVTELGKAIAEAQTVLVKASKNVVDTLAANVANARAALDAAQASYNEAVSF